MISYFKNISKVFIEFFLICKFYIKDLYKSPRKLNEWEENLKNLIDKYDNKEIDGIDFLIDIRGVIPYNVYLNNKHLDEIYSEIWRSYDLFTNDFFDDSKKQSLIEGRLNQRKIEERDGKIDSIL